MELILFERNEETLVLQKKFEKQKKEMELTALKQNDKIKSLNKKLELQVITIQESQRKIHNGVSTLSKGYKNELNEKSENTKLLQNEIVGLSFESRKPSQKEKNQVTACQDIVKCSQQSKGDMSKDGKEVTLFHLNHFFVFMPSLFIF